MRIHCLFLIMPCNHLHKYGETHIFILLPASPHLGLEALDVVVADPGELGGAVGVGHHLGGVPGLSGSWSLQEGTDLEGGNTSSG